MNQSRHEQIKRVLLESEDGLTAAEIADKIGSNAKSINKSIKNIWGIYIDRWTVPRRGQFSAVYMCVDVPKNAPHPTERYVPQTVWQRVMNTH